MYYDGKTTDGLTTGEVEVKTTIKGNVQATQLAGTDKTRTMKASHWASLELRSSYRGRQKWDSRVHFGA